LKNLRSEAVRRGVSHAPQRALLRSLGLTDQEIEQPFIAVANSWSEVVPGHLHLRTLAEAAKSGIRYAGATPFEFDTIAVCDGLAMGHEGMRYSLPSRDLIADSIEIMARAHQFDGMVLIPSCDKIVPGHLMAAARLNIPAIVVTGGPMYPGRVHGERVDLISVFEAIGKLQSGEMSELDLEELSTCACPGVGSCAGLFTANTMACITESLGMSLPGCATAHATDAAKVQISKQSGMKIVEMVQKEIVPARILTFQAFENAIRVDMAIGGSTNTLLHVPVIAREAGIDLGMELFDRISRDTPHICNMRPGGPYFMEDLRNAGGVSAVLKRLESKLNLDVLTATGRTLRDEIASFSVKDSSVVRTLEDPVHPYGGIAVLRGNLAPQGAVVKQSSVEPAMLRFRGGAKVYNSEQEAIEGVKRGDIQDKRVVVIRYEGQVGGPGMREMLSITSLIQGMHLGKKIALVTDGRFSGGTRGPCIGHVSPEAALKGPIAAVVDGDEIEIDIPERRIHVNLSDGEMANRLANLTVSIKPHGGFMRRYLEWIREGRNS